MKFSHKIETIEDDYIVPFPFYFQKGGNFSIKIKDQKSQSYIILFTEHDFKSFLNNQTLCTFNNSYFKNSNYYYLNTTNCKGKITGSFNKQGKYNTVIKTCGFYYNSYLIELTYLNPNSCLSYEYRHSQTLALIVFILSIFLFHKWISNWLNYFSYDNLIHNLLTCSFFFFVSEKFFLLFDLNSRIKSDNISMITNICRNIHLIHEVITIFTLKIYANGYDLLYEYFYFTTTFECLIIVIFYYKFANFIYYNIDWFNDCWGGIITFVLCEPFIVIQSIGLVEDFHNLFIEVYPFFFVANVVSLFYITFAIIDIKFEACLNTYNNYNFIFNIINLIILTFIGNLFKLDKYTMHSYMDKNRHVFFLDFENITKNQIHNYQKVLIPSRITQICPYAFNRHIDLNDVEFEENSKLKLIEKYAFSSSNIEKILIPANVYYIGDHAFSNCRCLKKVDFEVDSKLMFFEKKLFFNSSIETLSIPSNIVEFDDEWCINTPKLKNIIVSPNNHNFLFFENNFLINCNSKSNSFQYLLFSRRDIQIAKIPSFIKGISPFAFNECKNLEEVIFQNDSKLQIIDKKAFLYSSLKRISIPSNVSLIAFDAFNSCFKLQKVEFSIKSSLYIIDDVAFHKTSINSIKIPKSVKRIGKYAFSNCNKLKEINFEDESELKIIDNKAFCYSALESFIIPSKVNFIGRKVFDNCKNLQIIEFENNFKQKSINQAIFGNNINAKIYVPVNK